MQLGPDARTGTEGQQAYRFAAAAERHHEQSGASIFSALWVANHRPLAVINLRFLTGWSDDHRAGLRWLGSAQLADKAFDGLIAAAESTLRDQILPDHHRIATMAQSQFDRVAEWFAGTDG